MTSRLAQLSRRAATVLATPPPDATPKAALEVVHQLGLFSASLGALASMPSVLVSDKDTTARAAADCAHQLLRHLSALPSSADISEKVMSSVLVVAKQHQHFLDPTTTHELVREASRRFGPVNLLTWKPKQLLAGLHAIAKSCAGRAPPSITEDLVANLERALPQLNARDTALFLWCLAVLELCEAKPTLWDTTCRRCLLLFSQMNQVSHATVLHAVLLTPAQCEGRAQQELMTLLQQRHHEDGEVRGLAPDVTGDTEGLRLRLLTSVARLSTDVQLALMQRLCRQAHTGCGASDGPSLSPSDMEELAYLYEHLGRKRLSPAHGAMILESIVDASGTSCLRSLMQVPGARRLWKHAITQTGVLLQHPRGDVTAASSPITTNASETAPTNAWDDLPVQLSSAETERCLSLLVKIGLGTSLVFSPTSTEAALLDGDEARQLCVAIHTGLATCLHHWQRELAPTPANGVWLVAMAVDFLSAAHSVLRDDHVPAHAVPMATAFIERYPHAWAHPATVAREAVDLLVVSASSPLLRPSWCTGDVSGAGLRLLSRTTASLVEAASNDVSLAAVGPRRALELCVAVETNSLKNCHASEVVQLRGLWPRVLNAHRTRVPLLREITDFVHSRTAALGSGVHSRTDTRIPNALLELWIRHLQNDGAAPLTRLQEETLLGCFAQRAADVEALEAAFLLLVTRRLGESQTLLETRTLSPSAVVTLAEHACVLSRGRIVTASTILFTLMQRLGTDVRAGTLSLDSLNDVASLLSSPACQDRETRENLGTAVKQGAAKLLMERPWPSETRAYLVAYLVRAQIELDPTFLKALRAFPPSA